MLWVFDPHSGGTKIPEAGRDRIRRRILAHAEKHYAGRYTALDIRFRGALCYTSMPTSSRMCPRAGRRKIGAKRVKR